MRGPRKKIQRKGEPRQCPIGRAKGPGDESEGAPHPPSKPPALEDGCVAPESQQPSPSAAPRPTGSIDEHRDWLEEAREHLRDCLQAQPSPVVHGWGPRQHLCPCLPLRPTEGLKQHIWGTPPASGSPHCGPCTPARPQRTALLPLLRPRDRQGQSDHAAPGPDAECRRPPGPSNGPLTAPGERGIRPEAFQTTGGAETALPEPPADWTSQRPQPQGLLGTATKPADFYGEGRGPTRPVRCERAVPQETAQAP
ncbi:Hypothetical protein GLP15_906 [Giardia lamblia P15]|uniref:Uncharacterized protein n=1 Tax=Giardia intestinalis (strain P15) TaxID=658858 RepID=E1EZH0_GIAIA|nr:Hypothetical protein GLP15_906 [Giardia lamblia P15]